MERKSSAAVCCNPISTVKIAIVGVGTRGEKAIGRFLSIKGVQIVFLCDENEETLTKVAEKIPIAYPKPFAVSKWQKVCEANDVDLIYICTDWISHAPIALYAMQQGKHVAVEVPAAMTVNECWQLVDVAETYNRHCVILENCCYDAFELTTLNMVKNGLLGDIVHADCAYIHDLRSLNFPPTETGKKGMNRLHYNLKHNGNIYPTHAIGPVCMAMNINRGDRLTKLVSVSSRQQGITDYATEKYGKNSEEANRPYKLGDMNTSVISTHNGATIMLQHNISNPRPYSRIYALTGSKGFCRKYPAETVVLNGEFLEKEKLNEVMKTYNHPYLKKYYADALQISGDHFFDYIMDSRLIYCLNHGLPTDLNVYDAATWSCIVELTERSVKAGSTPIEIPDFTRGKWCL